MIDGDYSKPNYEIVQCLLFCFKENLLKYVKFVQKWVNRSINDGDFIFRKNERK